MPAELKPAATADLLAGGGAVLGPRQHAHAAGQEQPGGLLEGKLGAPRRAFRILHRARLTRLLDDTTRHRVTLLCAPAGSGKTTACASWARGREDERRIGWLSLDRADNDPRRFRSYLLAALRGAGGSPPEVFSDAERSSHDDFALVLVKAAEQFTEPVVLILDNIHELTGDLVLDWLSKLVRYAPPRLAFVLSGRRTLPLQLARLRVSGELADIDAETLACTRDEAAAYFSMLGVHAGLADLDEVLRQTEGWMAGLRFAAIRSQAWPAGHCIAGSAGDDQIVTDYLRDEILADHDAQTRAFLLRTSITHLLTGDLADALTNAAEGARLLDRLSRQNSLVDRFGADRVWYRYHPMLRAELRAELGRQMPGEIPVLLRRAARWHARHGMPTEALETSVEAQDFTFAAHVLADNDIGILLSRGPAELEQTLAQVPPDAAADPAFGVAWAACRLWSGDPDGAHAHLKAAENALGHGDGPARPIAATKLTALRVMHASTVGPACPDMLTRAWADAGRMGHGTNVPAQQKALGMLWQQLGVAHMRRSELPRAREALRLAERELRTAGFPALQERTRAWWALCEAWQGKLTEAARVAAEVLSCDEPAALAARNIALLALAIVNLMRDELAVAHRLLDQIEYQDHVPIPGEPPVVTSARVIRTRTLIAQGDIAAARAALSKLEQGSGPFTPAVTRFIISLRGELAAQAGDAHLRRDVIAKLTDGAGPTTPSGHLILSWLHIADDNPAAALVAAESCLAAAAGEVKLHERVSALLAAAVAHRRLKHTERATDLLEHALMRAEPGEMYRPFLDGGLPARSVLTVLIQPTSPRAGFTSKILQRFDTQPSSLPATTSDNAIPDFSDSELSVLRFVPSDLTNEEIGAALFLSVNTIKTHLRNIYRKLGARSRREATALARYHSLVS